MKFDRPPLLHFAFLALDKFRKEFGRFPAVGCAQDGQRIVEFTASFNEATIDYKIEGKLDEKLLRLFASGSRAVLNPMAAIFGGIVGQEVVKACSGKFQPLYQVTVMDYKIFYASLFCCYLTRKLSLSVLLLGFGGISANPSIGP